MADKQSFIGTWRLVSYVNRSEDGSVVYPLGPDAIGYITYSANGFVSVAIMRPNRPNFASGDWARGTPAEYAAASQFLSYVGRYTIEGSVVYHHLEVSFFPNLIGSIQKRTFSFAGNRLELAGDLAMMNGKLQAPVVTWERA